MSYVDDVLAKVIAKNIIYANKFCKKQNSLIEAISMKFKLIAKLRTFAIINLEYAEKTNTI